jgi:hypothetical protein
VGAEHPDVAQNYDSMACVHSTLGDHGKALEFSEKNLAIQLKVLGAEHSNTKAVQMFILQIKKDLS